MSQPGSPLFALGVAPPQLSAGTAASNADTVMFRHKSKDEFKALHDWLVTAVEHNQAEGIDPSMVKFDAAGETRSERIQAKADSAREKAKPSQTEKMTELLGDERPDIVAALHWPGRRRGWRSAARRRTGNARAGGPSGDGWRTRRPPECRAGPRHRRAGSDRNRRCRDRPGSTHPPRAPRWHCSRPTRSAGPRRRRPPDLASVHFVRCLRSARVATPFGSGFGTGGRPPKRTHMPRRGTNRDTSRRPQSSR
jgi:hypothetical protein